MNCASQTVGDYTVLSLPESEVLDAGNGAFLREQVADALGAGCSRLAVDLSGVGFIDSSGLGVLISAMKALRAEGGRFDLVGVGERVHSVLEVTRLLRVFSIHPDLDALLESAPD